MPIVTAIVLPPAICALGDPCSHLGQRDLTAQEVCKNSNSRLPPKVRNPKRPGRPKETNNTKGCFVLVDNLIPHSQGMI